MMSCSSAVALEQAQSEQRPCWPLNYFMEMLLDAERACDVINAYVRVIG